MKNIFRISGVILLILSIFLIHSCKKDKPTPPILTTTVVTAITKTTGTSGGNITIDGGATVISRGVCWSTNNTPTIADNKTLDGAGAGSFLSTMIGLTPNTTYFVRAYATNASGTGYGMAMSFTTQPATIPVLTTANVTTITQNSATCGGTITSDGAASITARGVCWSTSQNPTLADSKSTDGTGNGVFTSSITGLTLGTTYFIRAYATNIAGTGYGMPMSFTTLRTSGIDKIISFSYIRPGGYYYYEEGFSFFLAKNATTLNNPGPDIVLYVYIPNIDVSINSLILHTASSVNSFYKFGDYPDVAAAITAFNSLKNVGIFQWKEIADPINANQVWVYRRSTGNYAKIRIISMVNEKRAGTPYGVYGECIFEWLYQPDGSLTFPGK